MVFSATLEVVVSKLLRLSSVIDQTGLSKSSIYKQIQERTFPTQVHIGARAVAWLQSDIEEWVHHCVRANQPTDHTDRKTELNDEV